MNCATMRRLRVGTGMVAIGLGLVFVLGHAVAPAQSPALTVLDDFSAKDADGFPKGWKAQRKEVKAREQYTVRSENGMMFLSARDANQRVYKRIAWDPKTFPIVTWRWRVKRIQPEAELVAAVFVSLDTDLLIIPVSTKYSWSGKKAVGTTTEGGLFSASEIVLRSGSAGVGQWVEERVNTYEDFKRIHGHEPAAQAWGISLLAGPGAEVDFGPIIAASQ